MEKNKLEKLGKFLQRSSLGFLLGFLGGELYNSGKYSEKISFQVNNMPFQIVREKRIMATRYLGLCDGKRISEGRLWADDGRLVIFDREGYSVVPPKYHYTDRSKKANKY